MSSDHKQTDKQYMFKVASLTSENNLSTQRLGSFSEVSIQQTHYFCIKDTHRPTADTASLKLSLRTNNAMANGSELIFYIRKIFFSWWSHQNNSNLNTCDATFLLYFFFNAISQNHPTN